MNKENITVETGLASDLGAVADALVERAMVDGVDVTGSRSPRAVVVG